ncbi:ATP synthase subunit I [Paraglaciecola sp. L3A3]|uniref:ATP synthase subunit I n=1 Tax=Paraglaciecola sp. L3A3 TaxID=2686358 RepID=UPI00131D273D|nr:ATP synthase subunit I [Paraglaciecola sp. L3A3]
MIFLLVLGIGLGLGAMFFGGLWWTVNKGVMSAHPAVYLLTSLLLRMGLTLGGFYLIVTSDLGQPSWQLLLVCLFGFLIARFIVTRLTKVLPVKPIEAVEESQHAP